ncbi:PREDICTED: uncharacterized protein LOC109156009 [Ipomoea nil]|uniref:uncharacterized protein LOC109156009 n=1 Tax=Ipomoea nil TaxID=35883 RepID=UPI0009018180|nr:PREDICTED: uncharacterized protein LOC109156009 [Ipomoea nil]
MEHELTLCLVDSATTHTILTDMGFFRTLNKSSSNITTISNDQVQIVGSGRASIILPKGTKLLIENALLYPQSKQTLLSFKDICLNGFHTETKTKNNEEFLIMTQLMTGKKREVEELASLSSGLYYTYIQPNDSFVALTMKLKNSHSFKMWHDRLGHPGQNMMGWIISNSAGHNLSRSQRLQGDICGPISPPSGPFRYFMVLIDASTHWTNASLLSTRNKDFTKFVAKIIELNAQFPYYPIKSIRMDNAGEFTSTAFNDYCMALGIKVEHHEISWDEKDLQYLDPRTSQTELEVHKIINLQNLANNLPDAFTDNRGVTRSHIPAVNAPSRVEVPKGPSMHTDTPHRQKRGRPLGAKDLNPQKTRIGKISKLLQKNVNRPEDGRPKDGEPSEPARALNNMNTGDAEHPDQNILGNDDDLVDVNIETAINFVDTGETYNRDLIVVDDTFAYAVAYNIPQNNLDPEPKSITECRKRSDWLKWKQRNENNEVVRYKARLVAQGFTQRPGIDFDQTYSPVIDGISFRYLISLAVNMKLDMQLMDVVTAYLYGSLDADIYMKIPEGIQNSNMREKDRNMYNIKLQRSLYGLKESGRMWYNYLSEFLLKKEYVKMIFALVYSLRSHLMVSVLYLSMSMT